ncbi:hypothetical protein [Anaerococcus sp. Marseille-P3915]|uniref:hypothetical protein n=1 Tax=Anaerococcus sp. Marseille-P3915 TaxID=2057799 RepID=UPI001F267431|nr:hypothetical protein [Anaerococcus sp. Marseille-P3915]
MSGELNKDEKQIRSSAAEYLTYIAATGNDEDAIEIRYEDENIWLTQKMMATLYNVSISTINEHLKKIYDDEELYINPTIRNFLIVQKNINIKEQAIEVCSFYTSL